MKKISIFSIALAALAFASCTTSPISEDKVFLTEAQILDIVTKDEGTIYTLNGLLDKFMTEEGNYLSDTSLYRPRANNGGDVYLFSIDTLPSKGKGIYIRGRITTDDYGGNFYKSLCIQQMVDGKQQALRISVDASSVSGMYPFGQEILIRCNGLAIGRYADQPQLCIPSYNNNYTAQKADEKIGWAAGRIPWGRFLEATVRIGQPEPQKVFCEELNISDFQSITSEKEMRYWDAKFVKISGIHYTGTYEKYGDASSKYALTTGNPETDGNANVFAPTTNNVGFPQSRVVSNGIDTTLISCSEYAKFAYYYIPGADKSGVTNCPNYTGNIVGILGQYRDNISYDHDKYDWSITPRDLGDLEFKDNNGTPWVPVEYGTKH